MSDFINTKQREVQEAMDSGKYKVADLSLFRDFENIKLSDNLFSHIEYTTELLNEYLYELTLFSDKHPGLKEYLEAIKTGDILDNQKLEKENSFMIGLYYHTKKDKAIDMLIKLANENKQIKENDVYKIHNSLLYGTSSEGDNLVRTSNEKFVGRVVNHERIIDYFPIDYKSVSEAINKLCDLYNKRLTGDNFDNVFIQPFIVHGLIGALQPFTDGNTRMARLMQHTLIWNLINEKTDFSFELPPLYATRSYYPMRGNYRAGISSLVTNNDDESWEEWFHFNLNRIEDQIYANNVNIKEMQRKL